MEDFNGLVTGLDPGPRKTAWVTLLGKNVVDYGYDDCEELSFRIRSGCFAGHVIGCEMVASYGMVVGDDTFETVYWIGYFAACAIEGKALSFHKLYRKKEAQFPGIVMHICKSNKAGDSNIRQAIIDMYEPIGGGKTPQIGTTKERGPLYGISKHNWQAMAVAITCRDNYGNLT